MTLPRLYALNDYQQAHPPAHILLAAYVGYKGKAKEPEQANLDDLMAAFGAAGMEIG